MADLWFNRKVEETDYSVSGESEALEASERRSQLQAENSRSIDYIVYLYENMITLIQEQSLPFLDLPLAEQGFYRFYLDHLDRHR